MQEGIVYRNQIQVGRISKENNIYNFLYDSAYLKYVDAMPISVNFPLQDDEFESDTLFSFFANMLAEGNIKEIQCRDLKIDEDDHFTRLLKTTFENTIGSITVEEVKHSEVLNNKRLGRGLDALLSEMDEAYSSEHSLKMKKDK